MGVPVVSARSVAEVGRPRHAVDVAAPVDEERVARHVAGVLAGQEHGHRRDVLLGVAEAAHGVGRVGRRLQLGVRGEDGRGSPPTWRRGR